MNETRTKLIDTALGDISPDIVIRGGKLVNVLTHEIYPADILIKGERIAAVGDSSDYDFGEECLVIEAAGQFITPGFMDPHFHIETSSITVTELTKLIVPRGVTMVAEDPHEIANVLGLKGIEELYKEGRSVPLNFMLRVPGRVPALDPDSETSGGTLSFEEKCALLDWPEAVCLAGDINPQLILEKDETTLKQYDYTSGKRMTISGQSPGLQGKELNAFVAAGPEDSHVSASVDEVVNILRHGLKALLTHRPNRFQRADYGKLAKLIRETALDTRNICLTTDDTHANQLHKEGHLEYRMRMAIEEGIDPITVIQMVTINVADYFRFQRDYGSITPGKFADIVILDDLDKVNVDKVIIHGKLVAENGALVEQLPKYEYPQWAKKTMHLKKPVTADDLKIRAQGKKSVQALIMIPSLPKETQIETLDVVDGVLMPDLSRDISCVAVVERHKATGNIAKGFFKFPLKGGAYASSMSHDSHNIYVIGTNFDDMAMAVNRVAENQGGYVIVRDGQVLAELEMPVAGLLSEEPFEIVAQKMEKMERILIDELGCTIPYRPFYFLNLYCLPNVPKVGMTDKGVISTATMSPIEVILADE
jgi:adenine deaminase